MRSNREIKIRKSKNTQTINDYHVFHLDKNVGSIVRVFAHTGNPFIGYNYSDGYAPDSRLASYLGLPMLHNPRGIYFNAIRALVILMISKKIRPNFSKSDPYYTFDFARYAKDFLTAHNVSYTGVLKS